MASKVKGKKVASEICCPVMEPSPRMYIDLEGQDLKQIKGLTVGQTVQVMVEGKVCSLEQRERQDYEEPKTVRQTGSISIENYKVQVLDNEDNEYTKMADNESE